jgi:hypothetical protein
MFARATLYCRRLLGRIRNTIKYHIPRWFLMRKLPVQTERLIVALTPGYEFPAGGVMAITAMYQETVALADIHRAQVVLCTLPGDPPLLKYTWFENENYLLDLQTVLRRCGSLDYLLLHIPEYAVNRMLDWLSANASLLEPIKELHLNVLVFNIDIVQGQNVAGLTRFGKATTTTAHEAYSNLETRNALGVTLHRLLICKGAEFYSPTGYADKEPLLIVSPDAHPMKAPLLEHIAKELPELEIQIIRDLPFEKWCQVRQRAKWSLTFGEGLDGFFVETIFSGGVSFAVFNERFFTPAFAELENVYPSWTALAENIVDDLRRLDEPTAYDNCWRRVFEVVSDKLDTERFRENLRMFYRGEYTFP